MSASALREMTRKKMTNGYLVNNPVDDKNP
jgi:hypothetical protein